MAVCAGPSSIKIEGAYANRFEPVSSALCSFTGAVKLMAALLLQVGQYIKHVQTA